MSQEPRREYYKTGDRMQKTGKDEPLLRKYLEDKKGYYLLYA